MRFRRICGVTLLAWAGLSPIAHAAGGENYVSLGDSAVSGPLIPNIRPGSPFGCFRSDHNYPSLLAAMRGVESFVDASCSGATTSETTAAQRTFLGTNPPQFDSLSAKTTLVTVGMGANDADLVPVVLDCAGLGLLNPGGAPCAQKYGTELDQRIAAAGPKVAAMLSGIRARSPQAKIVVLGYLRVFASPGCWPIVPLGAADTAYLDTTEQHLNAMLADQARAAGAVFVDAYAGGDGHDMCAPEYRRWIEGFLPMSLAAPIHPTARGMAEVARRIQAALNA